MCSGHLAGGFAAGCTHKGVGLLAMLPSRRGKVLGAAVFRPEASGSRYCDTDHKDRVKHGLHQSASVITPSATESTGGVR